MSPLSRKNSEADDSTNMLQTIWTGMVHVWNDLPVRYLFILIGAANVFITGPMVVGVPVIADTRLPQGAAAFGIIMSFYGGGSLLGTLIAGMLPKPSPQRLGIVLLLTWSLMGLGIVGLAFSYSIWFAAAITTAMGMANGYVVILFHHVAAKPHTVAYVGARDEPVDVRAGWIGSGG